MKQRYYVYYYRNFGNTYRLYHAPADFQPPENWERITRKEAERLARAERYRRRTDPAFSGYADTVIYPHDAPPYADYDNLYIKGVIAYLR